MKVIKATHEHISKKGMTPYQFIEKIGRLCYKSEDKITSESAVPFVKGLCKRQHYAMTEHHWVHVFYKGSKANFFRDLSKRIEEKQKLSGKAFDYSHNMEYTFTNFGLFISAPLRVFLEMSNDLAEDNWKVLGLSTVDRLLKCLGDTYPEIFPKVVLTYNNYCVNTFEIMEEESFCDLLEKYITDDNNGVYLREDIENEVMKHITHTVKFTCDRGVTHELVRHRKCSFAQESTRYCNYSKGKFGEELTFIYPCYLEEGSKAETLWSYSCTVAEEAYLKLLKEGQTPQEARAVLPNSLKADIIMTCNEKEWQHIINLRAKDSTGPAHPQVKEIMKPWYQDLKMITEGRIV